MFHHRLLLLLLPLFTLPAQEVQPFSTTLRKALTEKLTERDIPFEEQSLFPEYGGFGTSLYVSIPSTAQQGTFVLALPFPDDGGFPASFEMALEFAALVQERDVPPNVIIAFIDDAASALPPDMRKNASTGLEALYERLLEPERTVLCYADFTQAPHTLLFTGGARKTVTPLHALEPLPALCKAMAIPYRFALSHPSLYHLGLVDGPEIISFASGRQISAFSMGTAGTPPEALSPRQIAGLLLAYTERLEFPPEPDTNYLLSVNASGAVRFIPEAYLIYTLLAFVLFFSIMRRKLTAPRRMIFLRFCWVLPLCAALLIAALKTSGAGIFLLERTMFNYVSYDTPALKIVSAALLYLLFAFFGDLLKIPAKDRFFARAAIALGALNVLLSLSLSVTVAPVFVGAFAAVVVGAMGRNPLLPYGAGVVVVLQALGFFTDLFENGNGRILALVMDNDVKTNAAIALVLLPILLLFQRGDALVRRRTRNLARFIMPAVLLAGVSLLFVRHLEAGASAPTVSPVSPVRRFTEDGNLEVSYQESVFLNRRSFVMSIVAEGQPQRIDLSLETPHTVPAIYAASLPFRSEPGRIVFLMGEGPPNPFSCEIVFPLDFSGELRIEALYNAYDPALDHAGEPESADYTLTVSKRMVIEAVGGGSGRPRASQRG
jgi:hypothetical protein